MGTLGNIDDQRRHPRRRHILEVYQWSALSEDSQRQALIPPYERTEAGHSPFSKYSGKCCLWSPTTVIVGLFKKDN